MRVLFWNTHKNKTINHILKELILENRATVVVLAEYEDDIEALINSIGEKGIYMQEYFSTGCDRLTIIGSETDIEPGLQTKYSSFHIKNQKEILCCIHLPSRIYSNGAGMRSVIIDQILADIHSTEEELKSNDVIIVGDLNTNPFETDCLAANKLHGIPYYKEAQKRTRRIAEQDYKMYYNPMWHFWGDSEKPYGTYYHSGNDITNTFWNIYDQVIISPTLRERFVDSNLRIITETKRRYLLDKNEHPDKSISDHLPIIFEIQEDLT